MGTVIILFALAFILAAANSSPTPAPVLDIRGKYLRTGVEYIAIPLGTKDGRLYVTDFGKKSCSAGVVLSRTVEDGRPLTFAPVNPKKGVIRLSTDVNIRFSGNSTRCNVPSIWRLEYDKGDVVIGGVVGNPGPNTLDNWFKIEKANDKYDDGYKFVYCPSVCSYCEVICKDLGIVEDKDGWQHLALSNNPLSFVFLPVY